MTSFTHDAPPADAFSGTPLCSVSSHPDDQAAAWVRASLQIVSTAAKVMASGVD